MNPSMARRLQLKLLSGIAEVQIYNVLKYIYEHTVHRGQQQVKN